MGFEYIKDKIIEVLENQGLRAFRNKGVAKINFTTPCIPKIRY